MMLPEEGSAVLDPEKFELVDGDTVADVRFDAGSYTLEQIVERVNAESKTASARVADGKIRLKLQSVTVTKGRSVGFSHFGGLCPRTRNFSLEQESLGEMAHNELVRMLEQDAKATEPSVPHNRHERRKQRALAQRAKTQRRLQGR